MSRSLDIIVPVYRKADLVRGCVTSLVEHFHEIAPRRARIVLIDDCPDDDMIGALLAEPWLCRDDVVILRNERNLGFVRSVNRGLRLALEDQHDALLVNSDTVTFPGTLAALLDAVSADPRIGLASPRSNDAAFCSLPNDADPRGLDPATARDRWSVLAKSMPDWHVAPTAVGFYMYVAHGVLRDVGLLCETYGLGYEEENDLAMRARAQGWLSIVVNRAFAWHAGGASFGVHDVPRAALRDRNHRRLVDRHPGFMPLMRAFESGAHRRAERSMSGLLSEDGKRIRVAFDLSFARGDDESASRRIARIVCAFATRHGDRFATAVIGRTARLRGLGLGGVSDVAVIDPSDSRRHAVAITLTQPTDPAQLVRQEDIAPVVVHAVDDAMPDAGPRSGVLMAHVAAYADGLVFADARIERAFRARFPLSASTPSATLAAATDTAGAPGDVDVDAAADGLASLVGALVERADLFPRTVARLEAAWHLDADRRQAIATAVADTQRRARLEPVADLSPLLALDGSAFVEATFRFVLHRAADPDGLADALAELDAGTEKPTLIRMLAASDEARRRAVALRTTPDHFSLLNPPDTMTSPADQAFRPVFSADLGRPRAAAPAALPASTLPQLLSLDGADFVETANVTLLLEALPPHGLNDRLELLAAVPNKLDYLRKVSVSAAGRAAEAPTRLAAMLDAAARAAAADLAGLKRGAPDARPGARDPGASPGTVRPASTVQQLLAMDAHRFVAAAYATLLLRPVDASGRAFYVRELERGVSRAEVLRGLVESAEGRTANVTLRGLAELLARATNPPPNAAQRPRTDDGAPRESSPGGDSARYRSVAELTALDGRAFVEAVYEALLHRPVDPAGLAACLSDLERGISKEIVIRSVATSQEARDRSASLEGLDGLLGAAGPRDARPSATDSGTPRVTEARLHELLALEGEAFVREAYVSFLRRAPDATGLSSYVAELRSGVDKADIVRALLSSAEARSKGVVVEGVDTLPAPRRVRRSSVWRAVVNRLVA
jgi:GT2 family glycosyltransferase